MNAVQSCPLFLVSVFINSLSVELDEEFFKSIVNSPLVNNPFFAKMISLDGSFEENGVEVGYFYQQGYICDTIGNLQCTPRMRKRMPQPHCYDQGVIDCTSGCPGTEEELRMILEVIMDDDFMKKYPIYAAIAFDEIENDDAMLNSVEQKQKSREFHCMCRAECHHSAAADEIQSAMENKYSLFALAM